MDDPDRRKEDDLASLLWSRQYADWRDLRFEPPTSPVVRQALAALATRMRDSFWQLSTPPAIPLSDPASSAGSPSEGEVAAAGTRRRQDTARTEPPTHVVDPYLRGDFATVSEAITAAKPGERILVRPGFYEESLVVDKPLEIIGDGPVEDIVIRARDADVLEFRASIGRVANLTLRQAAGEEPAAGVAIVQGRLDLEGCDISGRNGSCVYIEDGADPRLRRNKIHGGEDNGVYVYKGGLGTLEDNEISGQSSVGVEIGEGGDPVLRRNQIHDNSYAGVFVHEALGTLEDNEITGNSNAGVAITEDGNPTVRGNRINRNAYQAVWVSDGGKGVIEDNELTENGHGAWLIDKDCEPNVTRARNKE